MAFRVDRNCQKPGPHLTPVFVFGFADFEGYFAFSMSI